MGRAMSRLRRLLGSKSSTHEGLLSLLRLLKLIFRRMIKERGIDALVNECLIGPVLTMGSTFIAYACALLAYLYLIFTSPAYNSDGAYTPVVVAFSFVIGLQVRRYSHVSGTLDNC
jgi:tellurite resistance protein TehA-like permease